MARTNKTKNKFSSIANNTPRNLPFRETLSLEDRVKFDMLSPENKKFFEEYCAEHSNNSIDEFLKARPVAESKEVESQEPAVIDEPKIKKVENTSKDMDQSKTDSSISTVLGLINQAVAIEEEAGKNISVYLSAEALNVLKDYMKKHKVKNRSKLIESLILNILK